MKCIVLTGGTGDRLWPLSRKDCPKQFIKINNDNSLFEQTIARNIPFCDEFIVLSNIEYKHIIESQMARFQGVNYKVIYEEIGIGTVAALAIALKMICIDEEILVVSTNVCFLGNGYSEAVYQAKKYCDRDKIVLFGLIPKGLDTSYGYIEYSGTKVVNFIEKPSQEHVNELIENQDVYWNSGMILCKNRVLLDEISNQENDIYVWANNSVGQYSFNTEDEFYIKKEISLAVENKQIEKSILEKSKKLSVIKLDCSFININNYYGYENIRNDDSLDGVILNKCKNTTIINTDKQKLIVGNALNDVIIVNTNDAIYISDKKNEQDIKEIINSADNKYTSFFNCSTKIYRQWGVRELISQANGCRIRKITIFSGRSISSHFHTNRTETYTVVKGVLSIEKDHVYQEFHEGESVSIFPNIEHRLYNKKDNDLVMIEVDTGKDISETDIKEIQEFPMLYRLEPIFRDYLWGGKRLVNQYNKRSPYEYTAESWELSAHEAGQCTIVGGIMDGMQFGEFIERYGIKVTGWKSTSFNKFPILIKFIDAFQPLSIQIHPHDDYAISNENEFGKNEMWYIIDAEENSFVYCGFNRQVSKEEVERRIKDKTIIDVLNKVNVKSGDCIFIPAGTIHAIGAGVFICEIQQNSNTTYRVFDYDRVDNSGNSRELQIKKALDVMDYSQYNQGLYGYKEPEEIRNENDIIIRQQLAVCKYFQSAKYTIERQMPIFMDDSSFVSIIMLEGNAKISTGYEKLDVAPGDSIFIAAGKKVVHIEGKSSFILTNL